MRSIVFEGSTCEVYEKLRQKRQSHAQKPHKNTQTTPQRDDPTQGYGHPECLKHALAGPWSRKLTKKDRPSITLQIHPYISLLLVGIMGINKF